MGVLGSICPWKDIASDFISSLFFFFNFVNFSEFRFSFLGFSEFVSCISGIMNLNLR